MHADFMGRCWYCPLPSAGLVGIAKAVAIFTMMV
jgi:hypothetical protein